MPTCALEDCGDPACPTCRWSRPTAPDADRQRWDWLAANGFTTAEIYEIRAATLARRAWRAEKARKKSEKAAELEATGLKKGARKLAGGKPRPSRDPATIKRQRKTLQ